MKKQKEESVMDVVEGGWDIDAVSQPASIIVEVLLWVAIAAFILVALITL